MQVLLIMYPMTARVVSSNTRTNPRHA